MALVYDLPTVIFFFSTGFLGPPPYPLKKTTFGSKNGHFNPKIDQVETRSKTTFLVFKFLVHLFLLCLLFCPFRCQTWTQPSILSIAFFIAFFCTKNCTKEHTSRSPGPLFGAVFGAKQMQFSKTIKLVLEKARRTKS